MVYYYKDLLLFINSKKILTIDWHSEIHTKFIAKINDFVFIYHLKYFPAVLYRNTKT